MCRFRAALEKGCAVALLHTSTHVILRSCIRATTCDAVRFALSNRMCRPSLELVGPASPWAHQPAHSHIVFAAFFRTGYCKRARQRGEARTATNAERRHAGRSGDRHTLSAASCARGPPSCSLLQVLYGHHSCRMKQCLAHPERACTAPVQDERLVCCLVFFSLQKLN
jgi:hypothetical protein